MTLIRKLAEAFRTKSYITINLVLAFIIAIVFLYSAVFSPQKNNYPVTCIHEKITGKPCVSCGLSHSFSLIIRGKIIEAHSWNPYGFRVFLFFLAQLLMRVVFSVLYLKEAEYRKQLVIYDITGTIILFLIAFYPFLAYIFSSLIQA
ncbi:MAG TPA: DUF2752 domain-containing protein [Bacteroidales bacterium]|nr:DUF2752 domain-containing protein [Bacteroidales bacterium]HOK74083.1 DUF2752 domain-containing protein [Bacteroidales bacterium]HOM40317.1 DUF2752 domain-containing protein [Bacteroidales bacterium]HOU29680.1 DUF2752 domain-containing protein [Bacteroidales bacterium]HPP92392.1 DUF2752 domain-containing protein [Bacteroidales bacterium]